jgi:hypothetical protein
MKGTTKNRIILSGLSFLAGLMLFSCQKAYNPKLVNGSPNILVVEGVIDPSADSTIIRLSRTVQVNSKTAVVPELGAVVNAEDNQNGVYPIPEIGNGAYAFPGLQLDITRKYRLRIKTTDGKEYLSDFVPVKITPPIDSVGYNILQDSLQIYVNAHDPSNNTRYYRWSFDETWRFHADYLSEFVSTGYSLVERTTDQEIYFCYASDFSPTIVLASSAGLSNDVIHEGPLTLIRGSSEKIETEYSVLVRQYALTSDALVYWSNMKANSEQLGGIFGVQPSEVSGNIHCISNSSTPVIGYVSASTVTTKRIFISKNSLPERWQSAYPFYCVLHADTTAGSLQELIRLPAQMFAINPIGGFFDPKGYYATTPDCADCTLRGTTVEPSYWVFR